MAETPNLFHKYRPDAPAKQIQGKFTCKRCDVTMSMGRREAHLRSKKHNQK